MTPEALAAHPMAQQVIDASPFSLTQVWLLLGSAAVAYVGLEMTKRTFLAPQRLAKRRAVATLEAAQTMMGALMVSGGEVSDAHRQDLRHLEERADAAVGEYMSIMGRVWVAWVVVGTGLGMWLGWEPSAGMGAGAGFVGAMLSRPIHTLGGLIWDQVRKRFPGGDDDPKPRGGGRVPVDTFGTIAG